jgi:hypothetical protein
MKTYRIVRHYFRGVKTIIREGLTEEEAMEHCLDPETSSATCQSEGGKQHSHEHGPWFDGYAEE